jgi:hypothetical protein
MTIAFINGCLEPGRDGVGDYTQRLAAECKRQGTPTLTIGINDPFVQDVWRGVRLESPCLRFPAAWGWDQKLRATQEFLAEHKIDWVSLQFVPYSYASRGLVFGLGKRLKPLLDGRNAHIMFHECWIGSDPGDSLKVRLIGRVQRYLVGQMVQTLSPAVVHTSNPYYIALLAQGGIQARELPLFGSIGIRRSADLTWLYERLAKAGWPLTRDSHDQFLLFGFFGSIHPIWPPEPLFSRLAEAGKKTGKRIGILSIGLQGGGGELWESMEKEYGNRFLFLRLGEQAEERVGDFLGLIDYGLATTPMALIGKSASVAAMLEHGVPVIVNRNEIPFSGPGPDLGERRSLLLPLTDSLADSLVLGVPRKPPLSRLPKIGSQFLHALRGKNDTRH